MIFQQTAPSPRFAMTQMDGSAPVPIITETAPQSVPIQVDAGGGLSAAQVDARISDLIAEDNIIDNQNIEVGDLAALFLSA